MGGRKCCCCLFSVLWKLLVTIIVIVGVAILILWLILQPRSFKLYVSEAKLSQFDYANNTLRYDFVLNFTARNPNKKLSIYYDDVEGRAWYQGQRFNNADVITHFNSFRQYTKSTDRMSGVFSGQHLLLLDAKQVSQYNDDKKSGAYDIDVKLHFRIRFRLGDYISGDFYPNVNCPLTLPFTSNGTTTTAFHSTHCHVNF